MDEVDRLESQRRRAFPGRAVAVFGAAALVATLVGVSWSWHPGRHRVSEPPVGPATNTVDSQRPSVPASVSPTAPAPEMGTVFVQPLAGCVRTDHRHDLRIAMAVQNLADQPLQLVSVDMIGRIPGLTLRAQTVGARPCGDQLRGGGRRIKPSEEVVVALDFAVGPTCPGPTSVTARLGFLAGTTVLHAETANLIDLASMHFDGCG